ncbi:MAG TPA: class I adenylate-forming enzyme family protein [Burkholderiales bacterium]
MTESPFASVPQALSETARRHGSRPAILARGLALTHAELDACVARAAAAIAKQGVAPGDIVGVSMATSPLHLVTLLALGRAGACSVHVDPGHPRPVQDALIAQFGIRAAIGEPGTPLALQADPSWLEAGKAPPRDDRPLADAPWRIALSSGTTGLQKAVLFRHARILDYLKLHDRVVPMGTDERFLCHRGLDSNLALNTSLCHLLAGGAVVFPNSRSPGNFIEAIDRYAVTQLALAPSLLRELIEQLPAGGVRFPGLRLLRVGGSGVPVSLVEAAVSRVSPNLALVYGLVEMGLVTFARGDELRRAPGSVGRAVQGIEIQVVDERDAPLPFASAGVLRMRRAGMPQEYFRNPEATARAFRDGWFYPGDRGRIDADGLLYIEGRVDDKLNLDGVKIEPVPIEQALEEYPAVAEAAAFAAAPGGIACLYAAVVLRAPADEKLLIAHCRARIGAGFTPVRIFVVDKLPRNEAGKLLRAELSRRVRRPGA